MRRFDCSPPAMAASVHVYPDGSVLVASGGLEMGQGLFTKVKQVRCPSCLASYPEHSGNSGIAPIVAISGIDAHQWAGDVE